MILFIVFWNICRYVLLADSWEDEAWRSKAAGPKRLWWTQVSRRRPGVTHILLDGCSSAIARGMVSSVREMKWPKYCPTKVLFVRWKWESLPLIKDLAEQVPGKRGRECLRATWGLWGPRPHRPVVSGNQPWRRSFFWNVHILVQVSSQDDWDLSESDRYKFWTDGTNGWERDT